MFAFLKNKNNYLDQLAILYGKDHAVTVLGWLCEKATGKQLTFLMVNSNSFNEEYENQVKEWVNQIVQKDYPLQYILGTVPFGDVSIMVEPPVLIPRPETEEWVYNVLDSLKKYKDEPLRILDICTGSGCIAVAAAHYFKNGVIDAVDLYEKPLELTKKNALFNQCSRVQVIKSDLFAGLAGKQYDLILSNPPYIDESVWQILSPTVKEWEDKNALVADNKGLALYQKMVPLLLQFLKKDSLIKDTAQVYFEIGYDQGVAVKALLEEAGLNCVTVHKDFAGQDRMVSASF